jgi:putative Mn2+ efflux pump MntP
MSILSLFFLAIGLCFDSFAASVSCGVSSLEMSRTLKLRFAFLLALFQGCMPAIGWLLGYGFAKYVHAFDHWIAFVLLAFIGGRMIYGSIRKHPDNQGVCYKPLRMQLVVALATSIDALAVGVSFALLDMTYANLLQAVVIIGGVTLFVAVAGLVFGKRVGVQFGSKVEVLGGIILIGLGLKILLEHMLG